MADSEKAFEITNKLVSNIVEYIRYLIVSGIALISLNITNKDIFNTILSESKSKLLLLGIMLCFGIVLYFINRTIIFPLIEILTDLSSPHVFRRFIKRKYKGEKLCFFKINDLWSIIQYEGIVSNSSKYKIWRASIEMFSSLSLFFVVMLFLNCSNKIGILYYSIAFFISFVSCIESNINFERRLFNMLIFKGFDSLNPIFDKYIESLKLK